MSKYNKLFAIIVIVMLIIALATTYYKFMVTENYSFNVEANCNPDSDKCFHRDCSNPDDCPPNGFSDYRMFTLLASDFEKCSDNSCLKECTSGVLKCEETICGDSEGDECSESVKTIPEPQTIEENSTSTPNISD